MKDILVTYIILPMRWDDFRVAPHGKCFSLIWLDPLSWLQHGEEFGKLFPFYSQCRSIVIQREGRRRALMCL